MGYSTKQIDKHDAQVLLLRYRWKVVSASSEVYFHHTKWAKQIETVEFSDDKDPRDILIFHLKNGDFVEMERTNQYPKKTEV